MVRVGTGKHAVWAMSDACRSVSNQPCSIERTPARLASPSPTPNSRDLSAISTKFAAQQ